MSFEEVEDIEQRPFLGGVRREIGIQNYRDLQKICQYFCLVLFLLPSIIGIAIASKYNSNSACNDGTNYTIELDSFLYIGGGIQIGSFVLDVTCAFICLLNNSTPPRMHFTMGSVLFVWIIIGLNMYVLQMSTACHNTAIGKMILSWCLIPLVVIGITFIAMCVPFCRMVKQWMRTQV